MQRLYQFSYTNATARNIFSMHFSSIVGKCVRDKFSRSASPFFLLVFRYFLITNILLLYYYDILLNTGNSRIGISRLIRAICVSLRNFSRSRKFSGTNTNSYTSDSRILQGSCNIGWNNLMLSLYVWWARA